MRQEHNEKVIRDAERKAYEEKEREAAQSEELRTQEKKENGFVCISVGDGLSEIFTDLGVDVVIEGGQTMNHCDCIIAGKYASFCCLVSVWRVRLWLGRKRLHFIQ